MSEQSDVLMDADPQLLEMFINNAGELLDQIESDLLVIEEAGDDFDDDIINKVFRAAHTIKGESGFVCLDNIGRLAHSIENVLDKMRDRELSPSADLMNLLLSSFDELREMIENVERSEEIDVSSFVTRLKAVLEGTVAPAAVPVSEPAEPTVQETEQAGLEAAAESSNFSEQEERPLSQAASTRVGVLVIDHDGKFQHQFSHELSDAGIGCDVAMDLETALEKMRKNYYLVVVTELKLTDASGPEIVSRFKEMSPLTQVLVHTSEVGLPQVMGVLEKGAVDFLPKEQEHDQLIQAVEQSLKRAQKWVPLLRAGLGASLD